MIHHISSLGAESRANGCHGRIGETRAITRPGDQVMSKIEHSTLNDQAYTALKRGLSSGTFRPGQALVIRTVAENYGISTTPVREALQRLVAERLLVMQQNRSIVVPHLSIPKFTELYRIRCA